MCVTEEGNVIGVEETGLQHGPAPPLAISGTH